MLVVSTGFRCKFMTPAQKELLAPVTLNWWGTFDSADDVSGLISEYKKLHPHITIQYRRLREQEFEDEIKDAIIQDKGPDIISLNNTQLTEYLSILEPLPASTQMAYQTVEKTLGIKEETVITIQENPSITPSQLKESFLDVVYYDVVRGGKIYGLPLSVNTLVMFYNRDLLNNAGIPLPPTTWQVLQENVRKLTFQNQDNVLIQSGAALGTAENIDNFEDILSLLMMQNGTEMVSGNNVMFATASKNNKDYNPGVEAIRFYTDFANPAKEVYTWNEDFPSSIDAFAQGRVAMVFGYGHYIPYIEAKRGGKLNYGISQMPQIEGRPEINFANYWIQTVSSKSTHKNEAWDFIQFISKRKQVEQYLQKTNQGTALRSMVDEQVANDDLRVFARQLLTSQSWYQGDDIEVVKRAFIDIINTAQTGTDLKKIIILAAQTIQQTL